LELIGFFDICSWDGWFEFHLNVYDACLICVIR
jgi:hypothetical protein